MSIARAFLPRIRRTAIRSPLKQLSQHHRYSNMAQSSPFTQAVVASMRKLYPEALADKSFDNTGLLFEVPFQSHLPRRSNSVLLTIDLTRAVVDEAIDGDHAVVVAYHPIIFRGLKALTLSDSQQSSLLRLATYGVSVYCPHTAVDITPGGMGDWLCDIVTGKVDAPEPEAHTADSEQIQPSEKIDTTSTDAKETQDTSKTQQIQSTNSKPTARPGLPDRTYSKPSYISYPQPQTFHPNIMPHKRTIITPSPTSSLDLANSTHNPTTLNTKSKPYNAETTGAGRLITFNTPQPLSKLITRIATATGHPKGFQIAIPQTTSLESILIHTVGVCPGSGSSVLSKANPSPDLYFTGEMSHHEALAIIERGGCVIALGHSNSERGYLEGVMKGVLTEEIGKEWKRISEGNQDGGGNDDDGKKEVQKMIKDESVDVVVSRFDRDPFGIVVLEESAVVGERL